MLLLYVLLAVLSAYSPVRAQEQPAAAYTPDTCRLRISLLTCTPGEELYSIFGHTAIRVSDSLNDLVFNYGTFNFNDPDFYVKFIRGKLAYFLSVEPFPDFLYAYQWEQRGITEQTLSLSCAEKHQLLAALLSNAQETNRYYKYDFLYDNCTTRAGEMILKNSSTKLTSKNILPPTPPTFRELIHLYLDNGGLLWSKLGIDILLGSRIDRKVNNMEAMFLPDNLMNGMDSTLAGNRPLVSAKTIVWQPTPQKKQQPIDPMWWCGAFSLAIVTLSLMSRKHYHGWQPYFDKFFFTALGLLGCLLAFMWWGTDHAACKANWNLVWCPPTHLLLIWWRPRHQRLRQIYFRATAIICLIMAVSWTLLPQALNIALLPLILLSAIRSWAIAGK